MDNGLQRSAQLLMYCFICICLFDEPVQTPCSSCFLTTEKNDKKKSVIILRIGKDNWLMFCYNSSKTLTGNFSKIGNSIRPKCKY